MTPSLSFDDLVDEALQRLDDRHVIRALVQRDGRILGHVPAATRLGGLTHASRVREQLERLTVLARVTERQGYDRAVVLGDSCGWANLIGQHLQGKRGLKVRGVSAAYSVEAILAWAAQGRPLFVVLDGGDWQATRTQYSACRAQFERGADFVGVGRLHGDVAQLADEAEFREFFAEVADIHGAFGVTGLAGMVPAVLAGVVITDALARVEESIEQNTELIARRNPAAQLAAFLWAAEQRGRRQLHLCLSKDVSALGAWISALFAASLGPDRAGLVVPMPAGLQPTPCAAATIARSSVVGLSTFEQPDAPGLEDLEDRGAPGHSVVMPSVEDLWSEAVRWQTATVLLAVLRANAEGSRESDDGAAADEAAQSSSDATSAAISLRTAASIKALASILQPELKAGEEGEVLAILAFVSPTEANGHRLAALQTRLQGRTSARVFVQAQPEGGALYTDLPGTAVVISERCAAPASADLPVANAAVEAARMLCAAKVSTHLVCIG